MKLVNSNRFSMPGTQGRFVHLATVQDGMHEYVMFVDSSTSQAYIEEITGGTLKFIESDDIVKEVADFLFEKKVSDIASGLPVPDKGYD